MSVRGLVLVLRYRKAVTHGLHVLLGALEGHSTSTAYDVRFAETVAATISEIDSGLSRACRVLVLWSFHSPDAAKLAEELTEVRAAVDSPEVLHVAGGVHATAEPLRTLAAGWDIAAVGEGETTLLALVDAGGDPTGIPGLVYRSPNGDITKTGKPERLPLDTFPGFSLRWNRFNAIEITRGCAFSCRFCQTPFMFSAKFRHRSVENVRWHVDEMRGRNLRDVRFISPFALSCRTAAPTSGPTSKP